MPDLQVMTDADFPVHAETLRIVKRDIDENPGTATPYGVTWLSRLNVSSRLELVSSIQAARARHLLEAALVGVASEPRAPETSPSVAARP